MKTTLILGSLLFGLSLNALAQTKALPNVQPPKELVSGEFSEGTVTRLSAQDVQQFTPWAQNAQNTLTKALRDAKTMPLTERLSFIESTIKGVVRNSGSKNYQTFMRYALNRGLLLSEELKKQSRIEDVGVKESSLNILVSSINVSLAFYESDLSFQKRAQAGNDSVTLDYAKFGLTFGKIMMPAVQNIFDASAEYRLLYKLYEMINWDLSKDANANNFSDQIVDIYTRLNSMNEFPSNNDVQNLVLIRQLMLLKVDVDAIHL